MYLIDHFLTNETKALREQLVNHPFWKGLEQGSLEKKRLALFAAQDHWLGRQAVKIDTQTIAAIKDTVLQKLLLERLLTRATKKEDTLLTFASAVGLSKTEYETVKPLAGCMALTTYFYWMIENGNDLDKVIAIDASKEIFSTLCIHAAPALKKKYKLKEADIAFFTLHNAVFDKLEPVDRYLKNRSLTNEEKNSLRETIRLTYEHELLFYDAILKAKLS